jgi:hypothetical protein
MGEARQRNQCHLFNFLYEFLTLAVSGYLISLYDVSLKRLPTCRWLILSHSHSHISPPSRPSPLDPEVCEKKRTQPESLSRSKANGEMISAARPPPDLRNIIYATLPAPTVSFSSHHQSSVLSSSVARQCGASLYLNCLDCISWSQSYALKTSGTC